MDIRFRFMAIVLLPALLSLPACSRDEPASEPAPAAARKAGQDQAKDAADEDVPDVSGDPRVMQNPTAEEPGFLTAFADASETIGTAPFEVKLNVDVVENTGTPPYSFVWDFGDATEFSTDKSPTHVYKIPGSFRASVIIRDSKGEVDQDYIDLSVSDPNAPAGLTAEQLMQQVPVEEILRQAREAAAKNAGAADGEQAGEGAEP